MLLCRHLFVQLLRSFESFLAGIFWRVDHENHQHLIIRDGLNLLLQALEGFVKCRYDEAPLPTAVAGHCGPANIVQMGPVVPQCPRLWFCVVGKIVSELW